MVLELKKLTTRKKGHYATLLRDSGAQPGTRLPGYLGRNLSTALDVQIHVIPIIVTIIRDNNIQLSTGTNLQKRLVCRILEMKRITFINNGIILNSRLFIIN